MAEAIPPEIRLALEWFTTFDREVDKWKHLGDVLRGAITAHRHVEQQEERLAALQAKLREAEDALTNQQQSAARQHANTNTEREKARETWQKEQAELTETLATIRGKIETETAELMQRRHDLEAIDAQIRQREAALREIEEHLRGLASAALTRAGVH